MRIVVVTRNPRGIASRFLARDRELPGVEIAGVLLDQGIRPSRLAETRRRFRKARRVGPSALPVGVVLERAYLRAAASGVPLLDSLGVEVRRAPTLNGDAARAELRAFDPDLCLSLGNGLIEEATFALPPLGTINVHHGSLPEYRGGPPLFWELLHGRDTVGFAVHRIDSGIDTGPVLAEGEIAIERRSTVAETLAATIPLVHEASLDALDSVLVALARDEALERPQPSRSGRTRTTPPLGKYLRVRRDLRRRARAQPGRTGLA